jgi:hypothetical protein
MATTENAHRPGTLPSADDLRTSALALGAPPQIAEQASSRILSGELVLLAVNGWLGSGKDSAAAAVMSALGVDLDPRRGEAVHAYYANALKDEVDALVLPTLTHAQQPSEAAATLVAAGVSPEHAAEICARLWEQTRPGHALHARVRTPEIRWLLQLWGTDVRRAADPDYWVKRTLTDVLGHIARGHHVFITDARFPNEVTAAQSVGFHVVRLDVTREVQWQRISSRDGISREAFQASISHASETALDGFDGFDQRLDNNGTMELAVEQIVAAIRQRRA